MIPQFARKTICHAEPLAGRIEYKAHERISFSNLDQAPSLQFRRIE